MSGRSLHSSTTRHPSRDSGGNGGLGGKWIRTDKRRKIYERDGWRCLWCRKWVGRTVAGALRPAHDATLDHFLPRSRGGCNLSTNVFTACVSCNAARGDRSALEYAYVLARESVYNAEREALRVFDALELILEALDQPVESPRTLARHAQ